MSRRKPKLEAAAPCGRAFVEIQRALFADIVAAESRVRQGEPEGLHEFRVALRRTRVLHRVYRDVFDEGALRVWRESLDRVWRVTGPARDLDVFLESLEGVAPDFDVDRAAFGRLVEFVSERRDEAWCAVHEEVESPAYEERMQRARICLDVDAVDAVCPVSSDGPPLGPWASACIARAHRRVRKAASRIDSDCEDARLHELRIRLKKLRYRLQLFRSLYAKKARRSFVSELTQLQDTLGALNDARVQTSLLRWVAADSRCDRQVVFVTGRLVELARTRRLEARRRFESAFAEFQAKRNRKRFQRMLDQGTSIEP